VGICTFDEGERAIGSSKIMGGGDPSSEGQVVSDIADTSDDVVESVSENWSPSSTSGESGDRGEVVPDRGWAVLLRFGAEGTGPSISGGMPLPLPVASVGKHTIEVVVELIGLDRSNGALLDGGGNTFVVLELIGVADPDGCRASSASPGPDAMFELEDGA
jgi:hypothetical protein